MPCNGKIIPHTPLAVDYWYVRKCPETRLFFLTHMHSDHTMGLTSTWSNRPIYCSATTASLLKLKLKVKEQWIHPLELGEPYVLPLDDIGKEKLAVTLIDANHCPGAVMFLFEGYFGSILYTGDFRYAPSMLREPCLRTNTTIDVLYLDDTNCDPNRTLPSRQRATQQIKEIIRSHPNHNVVIGVYALGKESLLVELAMEFQTWVEVSFERMETILALDLRDVFSTEPGAGRIRAVEQSEISSAALQRWNIEHPTLAILPTSRPFVSFHPSVHVVPYSDHSSYQELEDFVSALKPFSVVPIVGNCLPGSLSALLPRKKRHEILVPECVRLYMIRQPERQPSSSAYSSLYRRHDRPLVPKGVLFDSPVRGFRKPHEEGWEADSVEQEGSEEDMDTESSERDSDCILVDQSLKVTPNKNMSHLTQNSCTPVEILAYTKSFIKPARATRGNCQTKAKKDQQGHGDDGDDQMMSDQDAASEHSEFDQDSHQSVSCALSTSSASLHHEYLERLENSILSCLPFSEEDFKPRGLLPPSFIRSFRLVPVKDSEEDDV